jgi:hypothetical protein
MDFISPAETWYFKDFAVRITRGSNRPVYAASHSNFYRSKEKKYPVLFWRGIINKLSLINQVYLSRNAFSRKIKP